MIDGNPIKSTPLAPSYTPPNPYTSGVKSIFGTLAFCAGGAAGLAGFIVGGAEGPLKSVVGGASAALVVGGSVYLAGKTTAFVMEKGIDLIDYSISTTGSAISFTARKGLAGVTYIIKSPYFIYQALFATN